MSNMIEYHTPIDGTGILQDLDEIAIKDGKGRAYGLEVMLSKDFNDLSISLSYTLSRNERKFDELNNGD